MAKQNGKPTSGSEWRKPREDGYVIKLVTSGNSVRLRPVALDMLIATGSIPDILTPAAAKILWDGPDAGLIAERNEIDREFIALVNTIVPAAMLYPRVVDTPQADDEISLDDLDFSDKVAIYQLAIQPAAVLRRFCDQQKADVEPVHDGQDDEPATEQLSPDS